MLRHLIYKTITILPIIFIMLFTLYGTVAYAAEAVQFTPLTDIPLLDSWNPGETVQVADSASGVFNQLFALSIRIGAMLAVFMFIWGGLNLITARDNAGNITKGKEKMKNAVVGLLMLLATYITLNTINPQLTSLALFGNAPSLEMSQATAAARNRIAKLYEEKSGEKYDYLACFYDPGTGIETSSTRCFSSIDQCVLENPEKCELYPPNKTITVFYYTLKDAPIFNSTETKDQRIYSLTRANCNQRAKYDADRGFKVESIGTISDVCRGSQETLEFMYGRNFTKN